ncbi:hsp90 co-chaperone Cdc37 [Nowakowskiella sp. JEL0078]|nr:hsp90 co-chaperone Cdc37 [Nowakowskiella sp. JEL0078]
MPIDYSKWDKLELSDDEDFECSPYVDKPSMIRWKQAQIHLERRERKDRIAVLKLERKMYVEAFIPELKSIAVNMKSKATTVPEIRMRLDSFFEFTVKLNSEFVISMNELRNKDRDPRWEAPQPYPFVEQRPDLKLMVEELRRKVEIVKDEIDDETQISEALWKTISENIGIDVLNISQRIYQIDMEIKEEEAESSKKITSDNIFVEKTNKTVIAKDIPEPAVESISKPKSAKKTQNVIETIHDPTKKEIQQNNDEETEDEEDFLPAGPATEFLKIKDMKQSYQFIRKHPELLNDKISNGILAEAFRKEMDGDSETAKNCVHQSLVLQYTSLLGKDGVTLFFKRMDSEPKAQKMFFDDLESTFSRIKIRVAEIKKNEKDKELAEIEAAQRRLEAATLPDGTYSLPLPDNPTEQQLERNQLFLSYPPQFQRALILQDVEEINVYLASLQKEDAQKLLEDCNRTGLITIASESDEDGDETIVSEST